MEVAALSADALAAIGSPSLFIQVVAAAEIQLRHMLLLDHVPDRPGGQHRARRVRLERLVMGQFQNGRATVFHDPELRRDGTSGDRPNGKPARA